MDRPLPCRGASGPVLVTHTRVLRGLLGSRISWTCEKVIVSRHRKSEKAAKK